MATASKIAKNEQRRKLVARYAERRSELKEIIRRTSSTPDERAAAVSALQRLPRDSSPVRVRNRDAVDGRPRGHLRKFGLSRVRVRELAHRGELPGVFKASWWCAQRPLTARWRPRTASRSTRASGTCSRHCGRVAWRPSSLVRGSMASRPTSVSPGPPMLRGSWKLPVIS